MKKIYCILILALLCILPAGCGKEEEPAGYYDIQSESDPFFDVPASLVGLQSNYLGAQFFQGEPIQIWAVEAESGSGADIYKYRMDGSRERLMTGLPGEFIKGARGSYAYHGYLDRDGALYYFYSIGTMDYVYSHVAIKVDPSGAQVYRHERDGILSIRDICQLEDGRIYINYAEDDGVRGMLGELDRDTGEISTVTSFWYNSTMRMGTGGEGLLCLDSSGIFEINIENGDMDCVWSFAGTTYKTPSVKLWDFVITDEGDVQLLWELNIGSSYATLETLRRVEVGAGKIPIVMRGKEFVGMDGGWFKEMINIFNQENGSYYVVLEECDPYTEYEDYARQTSIEVGAGKGPDIFYWDVLGEYAYGIALKGGFEDLSPYLESAGIDEGDYFPCAFERWRDGDKIYSISLYMSLYLIWYGGYYMDASLLGGNKEPDITALVDALLSQPDDGIYMSGTDAQGVLGMFLEGTEDIWGMVDWEAGTCDFGTGLFAGLLEAAKRYGDDGRKNFPDLVQRERYCLYLYMDSTMLDEEGLTMVGTLFDDGYHAKMGESYSLAVNANSSPDKKEGAWAFIRFLLGEEAQARSTDSTMNYPVSRKAFAALIAKELNEGREVTHVDALGKVTKTVKGYYDITEERVEELEGILENARFLPTKTAPILEIIYDEAQDYFDGIKSIEEVTGLINNRVQLYLNEQDISN